MGIWRTSILAAGVLAGCSTLIIDSVEQLRENNKRNIQVGTFEATTSVSTENNLIFNNVLRNGTMGIHSMANGTQNYYSQNIVSGNTTNYSSTASATFFNSRDIP